MSTFPPASTHTIFFPGDGFAAKINAGSAGVTLSLEMQGQHDAEKLLERLKTKGIQFELLT